MVLLSRASILSLLSCLVVITAYPQLTPRIPDSIPPGTVRIALDENSGKLFAFDASGKKLGEISPQKAGNPTRRGVGAGCGAMNKDDVKKLPGWTKLENEAKKNWGNGKYNLDVNPDDYRDQPANVCLQSDDINLAADARPNCKTIKQTTEGKTVGSNLSVALTYTGGTSYKAGTTVTKESSIATGLKVTATAKIPEAGEFSVERSLDMSWTNSQAHTEEKTDNAQTTSTVTQMAKEGQSCHLEFNTTSCDLQGSGKVAYIATGWAWFNYEDKTQGHYKWALNMDTVLSEPDRSSYMEFKSSISTNTNSKYDAVCK